MRNGGCYIEKKDNVSQGLYIEDPTNRGTVDCISKLQAPCFLKLISAIKLEVNLISIKS